MTRPLITHVSEAIDAELIALDGEAFRRTGPDGERLAVKAIRAVADHLTDKGFQDSANWLRNALWDSGA